MSENTIIKQLPRPWKIAGQEVTEIEVREPTVGDLVEAEKEAHPSTNPHAFNVALACQTLVRAGTHAGPFAPGQFKGMGARTWGVFRQAMQEADELGEGEQPETVPSA